MGFVTGRAALKALLVGGWLVVLLGYVWYRTTAAPPPADEIDVSHAVSRLMVIHASDSARVDLLDDGDVAVALVTLTCRICVERRDQIVETLMAVPAESRVILPSRGEPAEVLLRMGYPAQLVATPLDSAVTARLSTGFVPSFLRVHQDRVEVIWVGLPNRLQRWMEMLFSRSADR